MLIWDKANIPHKGWVYIGIEDLGEDEYSGDPNTRDVKCAEMKKLDTFTYYGIQITMKKYVLDAFVHQK